MQLSIADGDGSRTIFRVVRVLETARSTRGGFSVVELKGMGRCLFVDGTVLLTEKDGSAYYECLVHPAMLHHPEPKKVLIVAHSASQTAPEVAEVLRYQSVEECVIVETESMIVAEMCKRHFSKGEEARIDPRVRVAAGPPREWLRSSSQLFDVIIIQVMELHEGQDFGPDYDYYTQEFYSLLSSRLRTGGIVVTGAGGADFGAHRDWARIGHTLSSVFPSVMSYFEACRCAQLFGTEGWHLAFLDAKPRPLVAAEIDALLAQRTTGQLTYLDGDMLTNMFRLCKARRRAIDTETCVMTDGALRYAAHFDRGECPKGCGQTCLEYREHWDSMHCHSEISVNEVLESLTSPIQKIELLDIRGWGPTLYLDAALHSSQRDECLYHEVLQQPAMLYHRCPAQVFICGGGDLYPAREVLCHSSVRRCVLCDIDEQVVDVCKKHRFVDDAILKDPRLEIVIGDAEEHLRKSSEESLDVIIVDIEAADSDEPAGKFFVEDFYKMAKARLSPEGVLAAQGGVCTIGVKDGEYHVPRMFAAMSAVFDDVRPTVVRVDSYGEEVVFFLAFKGDAPPPLRAPQVEALLAERGLGQLQFLNGEAFERIFSQSKAWRQIMMGPPPNSSGSSSPTSGSSKS